MVQVKFYSIDSWNRPIFKSVSSRQYYGDTNKLFSYGTSEAEVLNQITAADLVYFGSSFDCEPMGTLVKNLTILR